MAVPLKIRQFFDRDEIAKANSHCGKVALHLSGDEMIEASLNMDQCFDIELRIHKNKLKCECTCSTEDSRPCWHSLAVITKSMELSYLRAVRKRTFEGLYGVDMPRKNDPKLKLSTAELLAKVTKEANACAHEFDHDGSDDHEEDAFNDNNNCISEEKVHLRIAPDMADETRIIIESLWQDGNDYLPYNLSGVLSAENQEIKKLLWKLPELAGGGGNTFLIADATHLKVLKNLIKKSRVFSVWGGEGEEVEVIDLRNDYKFAPIIKNQHLASGEEVFTVIYGAIKNTGGAAPISWRNRISLLATNGVIAVMLPLQGALRQLYSEDSINVPAASQKALLNQLHASGCNLTRLPAPFACKGSSGVIPMRRIHIKAAKFLYKNREQLHADAYFIYEGQEVHSESEHDTVLDTNRNTYISRDRKLEKDMLLHISDAGLRFNKNTRMEEYGWKCNPSELDAITQKLLRDDWIVTAHEKTYMSPTNSEVTLDETSNDWFAVNGMIEFNDEKIPLPDILSAVRSGKSYVLLGDGSFGVLPEEWLKFYTVLSEIGIDDDGQLIFRPSQALILHQLLKIHDKNIALGDKFKQCLDDFDSLLNEDKVEELPEFKGTLRPYQQIGLGWLLRLRRNGFGACLADDMGLGKTIQILAYLQHVRRTSELPALIVMPKSLLFNWEAESEKFTPECKILVHTGPKRAKTKAELLKCDLIITTYGTIQRDASLLSQVKLSACILDEAQAIKNGSSNTANACRSMDAQHYIAMSGTPIENHLGELGSLFSFLNPGMLGSNKMSLAMRSLSEEALPILATAIKPLILRRKKQDLLDELPEKIEQTIFCDMGTEQARVYNELFEFYRHQMLESKKDPYGPQFEALAALMRLRQAACCPKIINDEYSGDSVKIDLLMGRVIELAQENRKSLIFSQFTSVLDIIEERLNNHAVDFCRIDGSTKDRQKEVEQFQNNDDIKTFLISLKAGGTGLNLTAADTVFIIDPWWNPAAENQAVDRAWRMGQKNVVSAYRLISRNTVEEQVAELQSEKRQLADSILDGDITGSSKISMEQLASLLS